MKITVLGAGAVGGWFGGRLQETGHEVTFVARGETLARLTDAGLQLGDNPPLPVSAVASLAEAPPAEVVLLAVKVTGDPEPLLETLLTGIDDHAVVACTQNSVETPGLIAQQLGHERVWPGVVRGFFHRVGPAHVEFHGGPISYNVGSFEPGEAQAAPLLEEFTGALQAAGIETVIEFNIWQDVWRKAMFVGPFSALGAVTGQPLGVLRTSYRDSFRALVTEVAEVAEAAGVPQPPGAVEEIMAFADAMPADSTSSMQRDVLDQREHEGFTQVGAIGRLGKQFGVDTRLHDLVSTLIASETFR